MERMTWKARLKRDINLTSRKYARGTIVVLTKDRVGRTHIEGFKSAIVADKDWEMYWDDFAYNKLLNES